MRRQYTTRATVIISLLVIAGRGALRPHAITLACSDGRAAERRPESGVDYELRRGPADPLSGSVIWRRQRAPRGEYGRGFRQLAEE